MEETSIVPGMSRSLVEILHSAVSHMRFPTEDGAIDMEELRRSLLDIAEVLETPTVAERRKVNSALPAAHSLV